jgi:regulator of PEP synthase PpsR (kinase-PPPase family)
MSTPTTSGTPSVFIVSGGTGASGEQTVRTALAQFQGVEASVVVVSHVRRVQQLQDVVTQAKATGGIVVHTLVDAKLRSALNDQIRDNNLVAIDLVGPLLLALTRILGQKPRGKPGLYRHLREDYFKRIEAIEFTVDHDDGHKPHELHRAEIILTGVSRVGKTPLSMYLSTRGWKVANVPLVREVPPPQELFEVERHRVVGLTIQPDQLVAYRRRRQQRISLLDKSSYADVDSIEEEVKFARRIFERGQFAVVDMTDKPIEESAEEVIAHVTRQSSPDDE